MKRIAIICPDYPPKRSGLADHTAGLARWLSSRCEVEVFTSNVPASAERSDQESEAPGVRVRRLVPDWGFRGMRRLLAGVAGSGCSWAIVQYVPHMYGRRGFNLALPYAMGELRAAGVRILLWVHELFLDWSPRPRRFAAGAAQRLMLAAGLATSHRVVVSNENWLARLVRASPDRSGPYIHLPSPSNFEREVVAAGGGGRDARVKRGPDRVTFGFFGTLHDSKLVGHLGATLAAARDQGMSARLLCVGPDAGEVARRLNGFGAAISSAIESTGYLPPAEVVKRLQEVDVFLLPLIDGVSMRRGSLMAALSLGLPVVATDGHLTDPILRRAGVCRLARLDDTQAFAREALALARDSGQAQALGEEGRRFYVRACSWNSVGERLWSVLDDRA